MPPLDAGEHLIDYLFRVGPSIAGEVLTFQEIQAWSEASGVVLDGWEAETLRRMSGAYLAEYQAASDLARPAPYRATPTLETGPDRKTVSDKLASILDRWEAQDSRG
jgi:hypothetical protein